MTPEEVEIQRVVDAQRRLWRPDPDVASDSELGRFMRAHGFEDHAARLRRSSMFLIRVSRESIPMGACVAKPGGLQTTRHGPASRRV